MRRKKDLVVGNFQHFLRPLSLLAVAWTLSAAPAPANLDFRNATIVIPAGASTPERKAAAMLAEEIEKRTQLRLKVQTEPAAGAAFVLERAGQIPAARLVGAPDKAEGFTLRSSAAGAAPMAVVTGHDDRGVVFGTGYLLRQLEMGRQRLESGSGFERDGSAGSGGARAPAGIPAEDQFL